MIGSGRDRKMKRLVLREEYIKLGQLLKAVGLVDSGVEAKIHITNVEVKLNNEVELRRVKKLHGGDTVEYNGEKIEIAGSGA